MKTVFAIIAAAGLAACAGPETTTASAPFATQLSPPWRPAMPASPYPPPQRDRSRLPLPGDTGFAWDKLNHRGQVRWECRATPSGQFVRQSFCADLPQDVGYRPEAFRSLEGWDGVVHAD
jgi:hypothetical protein